MKITLCDFLENGFVISCNQPQGMEFRGNFAREFGESNVPRTFDGRVMKCSLGGASNPIRSTYSHFELVKMAKALDLPFITIYEDDAYPMIGAKEKMDKWLQDTEIPDDTDILMLGNLSYIYDFQGCTYHCQQTQQKTLARVQNEGLAGAHVYMMFRRCYDRYIELYATSEKFIAADGIFATKHTKDIVVYSSVPSFFIQMKNLNVQHVSLLRDKENLNSFVNDVNALKNVKIYSHPSYRANPITQFVSFATLNCGIKMPLAHHRWTWQIEHLKKVGLVQNGKIYSESDLDSGWKDRFGKYISDRGYAYWSWKPYIINQLFEHMQYGDSLCYFDGGCVFPEEKVKLEDLIVKIQHQIESIKTGTYDIGLSNCGRIPCGYIARKEITDKMGLSGNNDFLFGFPHWQGGLIAVVKTQRTEQLFKDWIQFLSDNYESCVHFPYTEKTGQINGFIHNGADQAVLQCLLYKGKYKIIDINSTVRSTIKRYKR